jgi:hypothetical protein
MFNPMSSQKRLDQIQHASKLAENNGFLFIISLIDVR